MQQQEHEQDVADEDVKEDGGDESSGSDSDSSSIRGEPLKRKYDKRSEGKITTSAWKLMSVSTTRLAKA